MGRMGSFSVEGLEGLQEQLDRVREEDAEAFVEGCAKELAARLLAKVIRRTPVGDYSKEIEVTAKRDSKNHKKGDTYKKKVNLSGKIGGTLRRGWTSQTHEEAASGSGKYVPGVMEAKEYVDSLRISCQGGVYTVEIVNPVEYALT